MGILEQIVKGVVIALLTWLEQRAKSPTTIENAETPADIRKRWSDYINDQLRDKGSPN